MALPLLHSLEPWTTKVESIVIDPLERKTAHLTVESSKQENFIFQRFSKLSKLLSFTSIYIKFIVGLAKRTPGLREKFKLFKLEFLNFSLGKNYQTVISALELQNA